MSQSMRVVFGVGVWAVALFGVLSLNNLPGKYEGSFCGVWGCWPPLQALAAMHGFWTVLFIPPVGWAVRNFSPARLRLLGQVLTALGLLALITIITMGLLDWLPYNPEVYREFIPQRVLFVVANFVDFPAVQLVVAGLVCWVAGKRRTVVRVTSPTEPASNKEGLACSTPNAGKV
jgi:hypothetical protein